MAQQQSFETKPVILVVEDNRAQLQTLTDILEQESMQVIGCLTGREAIAVCDQHEIHVAILDLNLPDMTGLDLLKHLKKTSPGIKVIINTAFATLETAVDAVNNEAFAFVQKMGNAEELLVYVHRAFHSYLKGYSSQLELEITQRMEELLAINKALQREIEERQLVVREKEELEKQLRRAHKMEAIGTLAGGIAHDFNNILGIIFGNTRLAIGKTPEDAPSQNNLSAIMKACRRGEDIIFHLSKFGRSEAKKPNPVDIYPVVWESLELLRASLPGNIEIHKDISDATAAIHADSTQINEVVINLCTNAAHAIGEKGGTITVSMMKLGVENSIPAYCNDLAPGEYVRLTVKDTGSGIAADHLDRIFDPYFTTKELGKGTGMGLAISHSIVKSHKGSIIVQSDPARGTTFHVFFPVTSEIPVEEKECTPEIVYGHQSILFVDDEEELVEVARETLVDLGYRVDTFTNPVDALNRFVENPHSYDLVITDMSMPKMTGDTLSAEMLKIRPDVPIILCTGFSELMNEEKAKKIGVREFVLKPLIVRDMAAKVQSSLKSTMQLTE